MYASLRLISAVERLRLPNRPSVRGRLILLLLLTMRGVRSTFDRHFRRLYPEINPPLPRAASQQKSLTNFPRLMVAHNQLLEA
jgi:hypothetical protein